MTNPDRDELVKLAETIETKAEHIKDYRKETGVSPEASCSSLGSFVASNSSTIVTALRRLASSEGGRVKGEPVAWVQPDKLYKDAEDEESGNVMAIDHQSGPFTTPLYPAPPADAGMREAFVRVLASLAAAISILERTPKTKKAVASDKMFDTMLDDYRKALEAGRQALTAPGATTKSGGGEPSTQMPETNAIDPAAVSKQPVSGASSSPAGHASSDGGEERQASNLQSQVTHGPSDPSSTRSEVTVERLLVDATEILTIYSHDGQLQTFGSRQAFRTAARALLDQFEIRRKK